MTGVVALAHEAVATPLPRGRGEGVPMERAPVTPPPARPTRTLDPTDFPTSALDDTSTFRSPAVRARILSCGREWANLKMGGKATGTWKEFFLRGCRPEH